MNWKTTWMLTGLALGLFAFIMVFERHTSATGEGGTPQPRLLAFLPSDVHGLQVRRSGQLMLDATRTNQTWELTFPLAYPAQSFAIEELLKGLSQVRPTTTLSAGEIKSSGGLGEFQLETPAASLVVRHAHGREELKFGSKTPVGDRVYVRVGERPEVYTVEAEWFDRIPVAPETWRDRALIQAAGLKWDRLEIRMPNRGFAIQFDPTNHLFYLSKPTPARADQPKVQGLLEATMTARVTAFVDDNPRADLERYGLQPPTLELAFGIGTNDVVTVQFGVSPTNDAGVVYARRLANTNIVLVPRETFDQFRLSHGELREKHLLTFDPKSVDRVLVSGPTNVVMNLRRDGEGGWAAVSPREMPVDPSLMRFFFRLLSRLEGHVERDVATDLAAYGLAHPILSYTLETWSTNAAGLSTNRLLAELQMGGQQEAKVFVRRTDEQTVYSVDLADIEQLPSAAWQLRDLRVWSFTTNEVQSLSLRLPGKTVKFLRQGPGDWALAPGSQGIINDLAVEETVHRLGQLRAAFWVARRDIDQARYGFQEDGYRLTLELSRPGRTETLELEFGGTNADQYTYALTRVDGEPTVFEFPKKLHFEIVRDLMLPFLNQAGVDPRP